jgi:hypothetical protein
MRVNLTIFGMIVVDTWLAYSQCTGTKENQKDFYTSLCEELIDNTFDHEHNQDASVSSRSPEELRGIPGQVLWHT